MTKRGKTGVEWRFQRMPFSFRVEIRHSWGAICWLLNSTPLFCWCQPLKLKDVFDWLSLSKCPSKDGKVLRRFLPRKKADCLRRRRSFSSKMSFDESVRWSRVEQFEIQAFGGKTVSSSYHVQTCKDLERRTWRTCQVDWSRSSVTARRLLGMF